MNQVKFKDKHNWKKIIFLSLMVILAAQININLFIDNFKISIAVICLPVFLFLMEDFALIPVTVFSAAGVYVSRLLFYWFQTGNVFTHYKTYFPEMAFYLVYGFLLFLFYVFYMKKDVQSLSIAKVLLPLACMDYLSNFMELILRLGIRTFTPKTQLSIIIVAFIRTLIIWMTLTVFDRYRLTLLNRAHANRYQRLMVLISRLNGEVVWMQKNTTLIEDTMNTSYQLYHSMQEHTFDPLLSEKALEIAKDIHEIKKEYLLIMRGLSEALLTEFTEDGMAVMDLLTILENALYLDAKNLGKELSFTIKLDSSLYTDRHYALMSVFHNLFNNALEACEADCMHIHVSQTENEEHFIFTVTDDGPGISEEYQPQIFEAGFSTKINYSTGAISRGLGLNIVQDIIESHFSGYIELVSAPGSTTFTIYIPKTNLEVTAL